MTRRCILLSPLSRYISVHRFSCDGFCMIFAPSRVLGRPSAISSSSAIGCKRLLGRVCTKFLTGRAICTCSALSVRIAGMFPFPLLLIRICLGTMLLLFSANNVSCFRNLGSYAVILLCRRLPWLVVLQARSVPWL
jgi:hypothetical protein